MAAPPLHPKVVERLKQYFDEIDLNKNGKIEANELAAAMKKGGYTFPPHVIERMIKVADKAGAGGITFDQFLELTAFLEEMRTNFKRADVDGNGKIDAKELGRVLLDGGFNLNAKQIEHLMTTVDADRSGTVEFGEYVDMSFYLQLLTRAFNQSTAAGRTDVSQLSSLLNQLGFDATVSARAQELAKSKPIISFDELLDLAAPAYALTASGKRTK